MPRRILVVCGDQYHAAHEVILGLELAGKSEFQFHQAGNVTRLACEESFAAVVLAKLNVKSAEDGSPWADEIGDQLIRDFVVNGGGLLVIHAGAVGYKSAPGIRKLTGGAFLHHPETCKVEVVPSAHPLTAGLVPFTIQDEHYFVEVDNDVEIFLTSRSDYGIQSAGWKKEVGNGRICTLTPGHGPSVWAHESFQRLLRNVLHWVSHS